VCRAVIQIEAKLELSRVQHEGGMPWRIEHDFNMNFLDTGQPRELALHVGLEHIAHGARVAVASWHGLSQPLRRGMTGAVGKLYAVWVSDYW
jgi:hypothetical protein